LKRFVRLDTGHAVQTPRATDPAISTGAIKMRVQTRLLYSSSNGDRWYLAREGSAQEGSAREGSQHVFVTHEPNPSSGGRVSHLEIGEFLLREGHGPQHQELLRLISTLVQSQPVTADRTRPMPD
jgi:hypothetical protein